MSEKESSLREIASTLCKRVDIGTAILPKPLFSEWETLDGTKTEIENATLACHDPDISITSCSQETQYASIVASEFNAIVIEHHLKWAPLCQALPGPINANTPSLRLGRYDFAHCDAMVDWAIAKGMKVKGHVLCWHVTTPDFVEEMSSERIREELKRHIYTTMAHFRGRIKMWDVVNESLAPDGTLANNIFLRKLGPIYIEDCFKWAHDADPSSFLIYNDNKVEGMNGPNKEKADGFYRLLKDLVDRGVPIHGAGMQAHFNAGGVGDRQRVPTPLQVKNQIRRIGDLGLKVNISEMDVRVSKLKASAEVKTLAQRQIYHDIIAAALSEEAFDGVWLWGFSDRHVSAIPLSFFYNIAICSQQAS
jgi:endo-1,4-beta-xylanase